MPTIQELEATLSTARHKREKLKYAKGDFTSEGRLV